MYKIYFILKYIFLLKQCKIHLKVLLRSPKQAATHPVQNSDPQKTKKVESCSILQTHQADTGGTGSMLQFLLSVCLYLMV